MPSLVDSSPINGTNAVNGHKKIVPKVFGTFNLQTIHPEPPPDPSNGPYLIGPDAKNTAERTYQMLSFRDGVFADNPKESFEKGREHLSKHGFSAFKHSSSLKAPEELQDLSKIRSTYYAEMQDLVKRVTGCKQVFITTSTLRGNAKELSLTDGQNGSNGNTNATNGSNGSNGYSVATSEDLVENRGFVTSTESTPDDATNFRYLAGYGKADEILSTESGRLLHEQTGKEQHEKGNTKPYHLPMRLPPSRIPHIDYTPLGARRVIRSMRGDIYDYAKTQAGVIGHEEAICAKVGEDVSPVKANSNTAIEQQYNLDGKLGPRYSIYSLWRPVKVCTRDPLAMISAADFSTEGDESMDKDLQVWPYDMRKPGFNGDWLWNLGMIRAQDIDADAVKEVEKKSNLKWHYIPDQTPDEVLMFKLFDSAALGDDTTEARGVPHGSPDLGDAAYGDPRESIELRAIAFW